MLKGTKHSQESREKLRLSHLGKRQPPGVIEKIRKASTGRLHTKEAKLKIGLSKKGKPTWITGKHQSIEHRQNISKAHKKRVALGIHSLWKGGKTKETIMIRMSLEYRLWREAVFLRDDWTYLWCGQRGGKLEADHIKPFSLFPELRFAIDNGRTLCKHCHRKTDSFGGNSKKRI